jgi:hypothetical protein
MIRWISSFVILYFVSTHYSLGSFFAYTYIWCRSALNRTIGVYMSTTCCEIRGVFPMQCKILSLYMKNSKLVSICLILLVVYQKLWYLATKHGYLRFQRTARPPTLPMPRTQSKLVAMDNGTPCLYPVILRSRGGIGSLSKAPNSRRNWFNK